MGLTHRQVMQRVELALAVPVLMVGVRTAAIQIVATEPLAAFFGSEGLGAYLRAGLSRRDFVTVQAGALLVAGVAIATELVLMATGRALVPKGLRLSGRVRPGRTASPRSRPGRTPDLLNQPTNNQRGTNMTTPRWKVPLALVLALGLTAAACGSDDSGSSSDTTEASEAIEGSTIRFAPQDFAESKTLTEVYAQYLEAQGFDVEVQPASGFRDQVYPGLENDDLDIIIDYTGSATRFLDPEATPSADSDGDLRGA